MHPVMRVIIAAGGLLLIHPGTLTDVAGLCIVVICLLIQYGKRRKSAAVS